MHRWQQEVSVERLKHSSVPFSKTVFFEKAFKDHGLNFVHFKKKVL
jgi:hypothetical protein